MEIQSFLYSDEKSGQKIKGILSRWAGNHRAMRAPSFKKRLVAQKATATNRAQRRGDFGVPAIEPSHIVSKVSA